MISIGNNDITCERLTVSQSATLPNSCVSNGQVSSSAAIDRSKLAQDSLQTYPIRPDEWRNATQFYTVLGAPTTAVLGIYTGGSGTNQNNAIWVGTADINSATTTVTARTVFTLPPEYDAGESVTLRLYAGMGVANGTDTAYTADTSCTIDATAFEIDKDSITNTTGTDLVTTAVTDMNSTTIAAKDFTITPTNLAAGDSLDIKITISCSDGQTSNVVIPVIAGAEMLLDVQG
jgi:hypothetical protein